MKLNITNLSEMVKIIGRPELMVTDDQYVFSFNRLSFKEPYHYYENSVSACKVERIDFVLDREISPLSKLKIETRMYSKNSKELASNEKFVFSDEFRDDLVNIIKKYINI